MGLFKRSCHSNDFVHDSKMKIYANLSEMMINGGLSYLFWECIYDLCSVEAMSRFIISQRCVLLAEFWKSVVPRELRGARVSWFLEWRIDRCIEKSSDGKIKMGTLFFFYFGLPTLSQWLLAPQKWFTYQNVQNIPRKTVMSFEQSVEKVILRILRINHETKNCFALA